MTRTEPSQQESNKAIVKRFFEIANSDGLAAALELLTDDASWWTAAGTQTKSAMRAMLPLLESHTVNGFRFECSTLTAEADRVAAEANPSRNSRMAGSMQITTTSCSPSATTA